MEPEFAVRRWEEAEIKCYYILMFLWREAKMERQRGRVHYSEWQRSWPHIDILSTSCHKILDLLRHEDILPREISISNVVPPLHQVVSNTRYHIKTSKLHPSPPYHTSPVSSHLSYHNTVSIAQRHLWEYHLLYDTTNSTLPSAPYTTTRDICMHTYHSNPRC